ncbi:MAG: pyruvate dehydrogenase (acetyl-transferring) E1 component subunit alpha [Thermomicrobiales bacterium]|nr:pyruvate dehydrogenase (acetyl-transferring) E1 component subunit alpha [Thermomicrobiales bacterium]
MATIRSRSKKSEADVPPVAGSGGNGVGPEELPVDTDTLLDYYRQMLTIRLFEEAAQTAFRKGKIGGYLHLYIGQEALATGFLHEYQTGDRIITAYRDHAHALLLGATPRAVMAELFGKGTGLVKGKGGSMHLFDVQNGLWGGYGIVGGHIPLGVGLAYAEAYQKTGGIVQLYFGDGAIHNGAFHEAANLAGLWGRDGMCPCLFILENNKYGMGTSVERATAMTDLSAKFDSYGIEHEDVDGMDLVTVLETARRAVARVRETGKPYAIEAITYRISPHGAADFLERYRSKEEVAEARKRDPINLLEQRLLEAGAVDEQQLAEIRREARAVVDDAVKFAEESPEPPIDELYTDVYADSAYATDSPVG